MQTLKVPQIAKIIGKTDKTIHNHRNSGKISMEQDSDGEWAAQVAEVQRAYNSVPNIGERIANFFGENKPVNQNQAKEENAVGKKEPVTQANAEIEKYKALLEEKNSQIEKMQEVYERSLATVDSMTKLLEHKNEQTDALTTSITQILERDQRREERADKRRAEIEKKRAEQEKAQKTPTVESSKGFFKKLFG